MLDAFVAMASIDAVGFSPARAIDACLAHAGEAIYTMAYAPDGVPADGLWAAYRFPDGSVMNIDARGCSSFSSAEFRESVQFLRLTDPTINLNRW